jgi:hypothetical protein
MWNRFAVQAWLNVSLPWSGDIFTPGFPGNCLAIRLGTISALYGDAFSCVCGIYWWTLRFRKVRSGDVAPHIVSTK